MYFSKNDKLINQDQKDTRYRILDGKYDEKKIEASI